MNKKILISLGVIAIVAAIAIGATVAYFSNTKIVSNNTFATGKVTIGETWNLPLSFTNLIPGIQQTQDAAVKYIGTTPADIYIGTSDQNSTWGAFYDPSTDKSYMEVAIYDKDKGTWVIGWTPVKHYLAEWTKIASNVSPNTWRNYTVYVRVYDWVGNDFQNKTNYSYLIIHAVQAGAPVQEGKAPWEVKP